MANLLWDFTDKDEISRIKNILDKDEQVDEMAYTKMYIPFSKENGKLTIKLYNTDPVNWNLFMFPYDAEKIREPISYEKLIEILDSPETFFEKIGITSHKSPNPWIEGEIKRSQSSGKNTLYVFDSYLIGLEDKEFDFESKELSFESVEDIETEFSKEGIYASNIKKFILKLWEL